ncbi:MAG: glycosyl hydrolase [Bacteroidetes bacterium]|nr:MAG: glycosyl hydrolase [Bacteroidota bacterium]
MIKKSIIITILSVFIVSTLFAQSATRNFKGFKGFKNKIEVYTNDGKYIIKAYNNKIIETSFIPEGEIFNAFSYAVVMDAVGTKTQVIDNKQSLQYKTDGISAKIEKSPFKISYFYKDELLIAENKGYIKTDTSEIINFNLDKTEALFGGGARALGMNRRGNRLELYNRAHYGYTTESGLMNYSIPMVISSKIYAIHFDNAPIGFLDLDSKGTNELNYETISGRKTYQVIAGDTWYDLIDQYTELTGKQPLPPRWAFGNFSSRFGYHSEKETRETVNKFIQDSIPVDAIIIDIYWFGKDIKGTMGNLNWYRDSFPTPNKMIADFKEKGVKTILVTEPFILTTSKRWDEAVKEKILCTDTSGNPFRYDFYFGNTGLIDLYKPEAKEWFWNVYKNLTQDGIAGWWGDLGEPEVHPSALQHVNASADEVHNVYGHSWAQLIAEGYKKDFPDTRPFILMRAGSSGSQRFGLIPWSGDVDRSWGGLKPQTEIALQMGMQGLGYMHSDLGGFAGGEKFDSELYTRWLQYGIFQPIFRPHAQEHIPSEPVFQDEKTKNLARESIKLRYSLMPYNYSLAFENNQKGTPFMRPLLFEEQNNEKLITISDTYLWGNNFLISPITEAGLLSKKVYFPKGSTWIDFYNGMTYYGGQEYVIVTEENHIPVFVRGGSFIPMVKPVQSTKYYSTKELSVHYYYDGIVKTSSSKMYDDDGETPNAFEKGEYELMSFKSELKSDELVINFSSNKGNYKSKPDSRNIKLLIHNLYKKPKKLFVCKEKIKISKSENAKAYWNKDDNILTINFDWESRDKSIEIKL